MRRSADRSADVRAVRAELVALHRPHGRSLEDLAIAKLFCVVNDVGLTADAIVLWPRPGWVEKLIGPYPASLELANPEDTASIEEWGSAGGIGT